MNKILLLTCLPILFQRSYYRIVNHLPNLIVTMLVLYHIQLHFGRISNNFSLFGSHNSFRFWSHFQKIIHALPHKTVVLWLKKRIKIIRLSGQKSTFVSDLLFLLVYILKILGLVLNLY